MNTENTTENKTEKKSFNTNNIGYIFLFVAVLILIIHFFSKDMNEEHAEMQPEMAGQDLTQEQKYILFEQGTEAPFSSDLLEEKRAGTYYAADTKKPVFRSEDKFDSGTGWPSFTQPISTEAVKEHVDSTFGMSRTEVTSSEGGHLGHVFTDGPADKTGLRYCINGDALYFVPDESSK